MDLSQRQQEILESLRVEGRVEVEDLAGRFSVTSQTIRRDLAELCDRGLAARTHGGARKIATVSNREYHERRLLRGPEKESMGTLAAELIPNNCSVTLNIGTTTEQVARALSRHEGLMVMSNNINIINQFMGSRVRELILVGGAVRTSDGAIVGEEAVEFISRYKVDFAVIGASALDADGAILDYDTREVSVARAILRNSRHRICVADSSKFDLSAPVRICDVGDLDYFITDTPPPRAFVEAAERANTQILTVDEHNGLGLKSA
ncbi:MAG: DeoR/GlpR family DNA-binding transcription regulator [Pseudomonadota bacterium]|nr:DeoR/GlpR family DNA-binding transcription regulator [Pseudomonadota bacterium]